MDLSRVTEHSPTPGSGVACEAAVLIPVCSRAGEPHLLFTKRTAHLREHPGQMSFPGGGREQADESLEATAKREADEEIGLRPEEPEIVGRLDDLRDVTSYVIRPFVGQVPDREYEPDEREVAEIVTLPVAAFVDPEHYENQIRAHPDYGRIRTHYFHVDGYTVWGMTAQMLASLLVLTTDWRPPVPIDRVVDTDVDGAGVR